MLSYPARLGDVVELGTGSSVDDFMKCKITDWYFRLWVRWSHYRREVLSEDSASTMTLRYSKRRYMQDLSM